jgi:transcriptional regulator GlxA family with amidase domain
MRKNIIKPMTIKELAAVYQVSTSTFKRWIVPFDEKIGEKVGWFYKPLQVKKIFQLLGKPN